MLAPKTKKSKSRRRRRDEDPGSGDDSDSSNGTSRSGSASGESGSEDEVEEGSEGGDDRDEEEHEIKGEAGKELPAEGTDPQVTESHDDASAADDASASEPEEIPFEDFNASISQPTSQPSQESQPTTTPAPQPRQSNRQAYLSRIASDPTFVPRVGKFWTHDQRLYAGGKVGEGELGGLRQMSEYWRGRGRGFARGARGGARGGASEARNATSEASKTPIPEKDPQSNESTNESTDTPASIQPSTAAASATKWTAASPGRSDRGSWAHDGYAQLAREEELRAAARERSARGRGAARGMVRGMFRGRGRGGVAQGHAVQPARATPIEDTPIDASAPSPPVEDVVPDAAANPPFSDHEPSAITAHLQSQAEQAETLQQQQLADAAARLSLSPHPHAAQSPRPLSGPPTMLPPGIAMHPSGTFYDIHTGQPVVWVPSPSPNIPRYPEPYAQQAFPQQTYPYPTYPYYRPQEYYPPPPHQQFQRNDSPFMPYPAVDPTYFIPPRPASKIEIRAPGQPASNATAIASATLKDPARFVSQRGYQQQQGGYQGYEYGSMGYQ